ncbi:Carbonic anhydrase, alpha class [Pseudomonas chlororaphis subsp. aurantiaca]|uniref:carbonic anhydrase n=1 Tax=Pseudomonas chlororaphis TaxID=587753 RepID=UPI000F587144|nr:carbonic anhydrase family protein [Pseudomonas chlororaphis]AZD55521.1 Carbonic anhydrase, alpha class [Pseudomonas chlororaphis subsp. aurantiaca]
MKVYRCFYLLAPIYLSLPSVHPAETHWSYRGNHGPTHWGEFGSNLCAEGTQQSPINVEMKQVRPLKGHDSDLKISYRVAPLDLVNNGHTIQANVMGGGTVSFKGNEYRLMQFHFHTPSEHQINHRSYPMEMHWVNQDQEGHLLVLGVMLKEGEKNQALSQFWRQLPVHQGTEIALDPAAAPDLGTLLPAASHHLFYKGSLTTPPCTEDVQWVLFEQPIELSKAQIHKFRQLFPENHRPPQRVNEREVDED